MRRAHSAFLACAALALGCAGGGSAKLSSANAAPTSAADVASFKLQGLDGAQHAAESLRGKVVLLDFWATWCEPCKRGLPKAAKLVRDNAARGLVGYAVSADEDAGAVPGFVAKEHVELPVLLDPNGVLAEKLGGSQLPFTVVLDRRGVVRLRANGVDDETEQRIAGTVAELLAEPAP